MKLGLIIIGMLVIAGMVWVLLFSKTTNQSATNINEILTTQQADNEAKPIASASAVGLANPAAVNCAKVGGISKIMTNGAGGQYGLCQFADNQACEEWALFRGQCPVGGVKTTAYSTVQESYCVWLGGQTIDGSNPKCTFLNGKVCSDEDLYNGVCSAN